MVLIPKVANPKDMTQFRSISLCNVIYKIISKALVDRLKPILPNITSKFQSAFVPERLILDNIILAFKAMHFLKIYKTMDKGYVGVCGTKIGHV